MTGRMRIRLVLFCAAVLLVPILSLFDENSDVREVTAIQAMVIIAFVLTAVAHVPSVSAPLHAGCIATPSDPRSPPR